MEVIVISSASTNFLRSIIEMDGMKLKAVTEITTVSDISEDVASNCKKAKLAA